MLRSYREAEHASGFSKPQSQSCPKSARTVSSGGEFPMRGDTETATEGPLGRDAGKGILTLSGAGPNGLACFNHTHFGR